MVLLAEVNIEKDILTTKDFEKKSGFRRPWGCLLSIGGYDALFMQNLAKELKRLSEL